MIMIVYNLTTRVNDEPSFFYSYYLQFNLVLC